MKKEEEENASVHAVGLVLVREKAIEVLGSPQAAEQWLSNANQALQGYTPREFAGRPMGTRAVLEVLNSIDHGMFS